MPAGGTRRSPRLGALIAGVAACGAVFATAVVTLGASDRVGAPSDDQTPAGGAAWVVPVLIGGLAVLAAVALAAIVLQRRHQRPPAPGPAPPISPLIHQIEPPRNLPAPWHIIDYKNRMVFNLNASGG